MKGNRRYSIKTQIMLMFLLIMMGTILLFLIFNEFFLQKFYLRDKEKQLGEIYTDINEAASSGSITSESFSSVLQKSAGRGNIGILVLDAESRTITSYSTNPGILMKRLYDNMFDMNQQISSSEAGKMEEGSAGSGQSDSQNGSGSRTESDAGSMPDDFVTYILDILMKNDHYTLQTVLDRSTASRYMELWGTLDNGYLFLLRSPLESIRDAASIANRFFLYTAVIALGIGLAAALTMSRRITRPILELTAVSDRMKQLDFSAKYTGHDRTEVGQLGSNINELSSTLEKTISELRDANARLEEDIRKKEQIDDMRKEFLSNVTHELKTPIALIQGYAEGLEDCVNDDPESRDYYAGVIVDEAGKMNSMVQKLLSLNHLEFGGETVNMEHFDLVGLLAHCLETDKKLAEEKQAAVTMTPAPGEKEIMVWSDSFLLEEVFTNYFSNACNHVEADGPAQGRIEISVSEVTGEDRVRVSVFNTGKPIPEESLPRIWEKFYKVDKARTRAYGGSGIGLSIVKAVMELLREQYGAINRENGVEFWFTVRTRNEAMETTPEPEPEDRLSDLVNLQETGQSANDRSVV